MSELKITTCKGEGLGGCDMCIANGKWSRTWMCFLFEVEGYDGVYCSDCVKKIKSGILDIKSTRCQDCSNYQPYEPDAGLLEGCTTPELYADEDCQQLIPEVNAKIIGYMRELGEGCPYFRKE